MSANTAERVNMEIDPFDYDCEACKIARIDYNNLENITDNLTYLVARLSRRIKLINPDDVLANHAVDYLIRNNLIESPLRGDKHD